MSGLGMRLHLVVWEWDYTLSGLGMRPHTQWSGNETTH